MRVALAFLFGGMLLSTPVRGSEALFYSLVNWDYPKREKLMGWLTTSQVIETTLRERFPEQAPARFVQNISPEALIDFLRELPQRAGESSPPAPILYLASHQSADSDWEFPNGQISNWKELLARSPGVRPRLGLLILDACHASSVLEVTGWREFFPCFLLTAARTNQETLEVDFALRRPVDYARRYPAEAAWLHQHLGEKWNGRISFLGLIWLHSVLELAEVPSSVAQGPEEPVEWAKKVSRLCEENAEHFRTQRSHRVASELRLIPPSLP